MMNQLHKKIALQLYSVRAVGNLEARLQLAHETGYRWVETEVMYGLNPQDFADTLQRYEMQLASMHVEMTDLRDHLSDIREALKLSGCTQLVMPWLEENERPTDVASWVTFAGQLNNYALNLAESGIRLAYHNHAFEFEILNNGQTILEIILENAANLAWQADVAWVVRAGQDPLVWLQRYADRLQSVHVKDLSMKGANPEENDWANLGEGQINWTQLLTNLPSQLQTFIVEHDQPSDPRRTAEVGYRFLSQYLS